VDFNKIFSVMNFAAVPGPVWFYLARPNLKYSLLCNQLIP
jgi:hypothetical protein